jgi:hypothetical protein
MPLITHKTTVRRWTNRHTYESRQELCRHTLIFGVCIWTRVLDTEEVPIWASIQVACLGSTDWRSKFADHIPT